MVVIHDACLVRACRSDTSTSSFPDNVSLGHVSGVEVLASGVWSGEFVFTASIEVTAKTTGSSTEPTSNADGGVVTSVSDHQAERFADEEDVLVVVLVDLENLGVTIGNDDLLGQSMRFSIDDNIVHVVELNLVFSSKNLETKLVIGNLLSEDGEPWLLRAVSRDEGVALREVSEVGGIIVGLDSMRSNITVSVNSQLVGLVHEFRDTRVEWTL